MEVYPLNSEGSVLKDAMSQENTLQMISFVVRVLRVLSLKSNGLLFFSRYTPDKLNRRRINNKSVQEILLYYWVKNICYQHD